MPCQQLITARKGPQSGERVQCNAKGKTYAVGGHSFHTVMELCDRHMVILAKTHSITLTMETASSGPTPLETGTLKGEQGNLLGGDL
jgi:hypothetical protein